MKKISEINVEFNNYNQLSFIDNKDTHVVLLLDNEPIGNVKVFIDADNEKREYICVNNEIIYLDTITCF